MTNKCMPGTIHGILTTDVQQHGGQSQGGNAEAFGQSDSHKRETTAWTEMSMDDIEQAIKRY